MGADVRALARQRFGLSSSVMSFRGLAFITYEINGKAVKLDHCWHGGCCSMWVWILELPTVQGLEEGCPLPFQENPRVFSPQTGKYIICCRLGVSAKISHVAVTLDLLHDAICGV